jgi:hypothetical protein
MNQNHLNALEATQRACRAFAFEYRKPEPEEKPVVVIVPPVTGREAPRFFDMLEAA